MVGQIRPSGALRRLPDATHRACQAERIWLHQMSHYQRPLVLHLGSQAITVKLSFSEFRQPFTKSGQELWLRVMCGRFTFSAISHASSTSIHRYLTVLSTLLILSGRETQFRKYQVNRAHLGQEGIALS